jgi:hypothetical protein
LKVTAFVSVPIVLEIGPALPLTWLPANYVSSSFTVGSLSNFGKSAGKARVLLRVYKNGAKTVSNSVIGFALNRGKPKRLVAHSKGSRQNPSL